MYVYIYICMFIHIYICVYIYICIYLYIHIDAYICMSVWWPCASNYYATMVSTRWYPQRRRWPDSIANGWSTLWCHWRRRISSCVYGVFACVRGHIHVRISTSNSAIQSMQLHATRQGANFLNWIWVAGHTYLVLSHTTWVPTKIVTPIFDKNPGQPSPGLAPPPIEMFRCKRVPRGRWCILLCTLSSNILEKRVTWQ